MKRKLLTTLLALLLAISMLGLFACGNGGSSNTGDNQQEQEQPGENGDDGNNGQNNQTPENEWVATEGLAYELSSDGTYYICTGMGNSTDTTVNIANVYKNLPVKEIKENAFSGCINVKNITIPSNIKTMGENAFSDCTGLIEINFNATEMNDLLYVELEVFNMVVFCNIGVYSEGVTVNIAKNVKRIPAGLFCPIIDFDKETIEGFNNIKTVKFAEDSVCEVIGLGAFFGCTSLQSVTIGSGVTSIGDMAFYYCSSLQSITIPNSVTSIGAEAFYDCSSLQSITIPNSVTSIGDMAFSSCRSLESITIPNSVTSIGNDAFSLCSSLESINYNGTKAQWEAIGKVGSWNEYTGNYTIHCSDGDIAKS